MKVKLFWKNTSGVPKDRGPRDLEEEINAWLSENPHVKIIGIKQSSSGGSWGPSLWFVSIWYEESAAQPLEN
jgi:hypothetical protein